MPTKHTAESDPSASRQQSIARFRRRRAARANAADGTGAERTAEIYAWAADRLDAWLSHIGDPRDFSALDPDTIDDFLAAFAKGTDGFTSHAPSYVNQIYRSLRPFYAWVADRYEIADPMQRVAPRSIGERRVDSKVLSEKQLTAILDTVAHNHRDLVSVRDHAMLRLLLTGIRRAELIALGVDDIDIDNRNMWVRGKGDAAGERGRVVEFGLRTQEALDDYLELRQRHPEARRPQLWLGKRGVITGRGLHEIVRKRGEQAGIAGVHPHMFRHTAADRWLADGGNEGHLMENMGWKSRAMVDHYAKATRAKRAREEARHRALDDRV